MSYSAIAELLGVPATTAGDIFRRAVNNATAKRVLREKEEAIQQAGYEADQYLAGIDSVLAALGMGSEDSTDIQGGASEVAPGGASKVVLGGASEVASEVMSELALDAVSGRARHRGELSENLSAGEPELSVVELIASDVLDVTKKPGRPSILSAEEKDRLVACVKRDFHTRRMKLVTIRREAGFDHVSDSTVYRALLERGMKAYREDFEFILTPEKKVIQLVCMSLVYWVNDSVNSDTEIL